MRSEKNSWNEGKTLNGEEKAKAFVVFARMVYYGWHSVIISQASRSTKQ